MANLIQWSDVGSLVLVLNGDATTPTLKNLGIDGLKISDEIDPGATPDSYMDFRLRARFISSPGKAVVQGWFIIDVGDAGAYEDGSDSVEPNRNPDFTFITREVVRQVGGFNPLFRGAGYAHGEWSERIRKAGLISHPLGWWDVKEARDKFEQRGDTTGGRWNHDPHEIKEQLKSNKITQKRLKRVEYLYCPLVFE